MPEGQRLIAVTGASSGIGAAIAEEFAAHDYPTLAMARRSDRLEELAIERGVRAVVDVTDPAAARAAIADAEARFGPVDLLVNNAGVMPLGRIDEQDPQEWRQLFDVNCLALLELTQAVLPGMLKRQRGTIVNISSIAGRYVYPNHTAYSGTKFAVHAMTESMRREYAASGVRFQILAPGLVETDLVLGTSSEETRTSYLAGRERLGGGIDPRIVAQSVRFSYELPQEVCMREIVVAPTAQTS